MTSLKTWMSMEDQLARLKQRGLSVEDDAAALGYLRRIGYYRLSGYWYPLRSIDKAASERDGRPVRFDEFPECLEEFRKGALFSLSLVGLKFVHIEFDRSFELGNKLRFVSIADDNHIF